MALVFCWIYISIRLHVPCVAQFSQSPWDPLEAEDKLFSPPSYLAILASPSLATISGYSNSNGFIFFFEIFVHSDHLSISQRYMGGGSPISIYLKLLGGGQTWAVFLVARIRILSS